MHQAALHSVMKHYFVDGELALEAAALSLVQRNLHGVVYVAHLMAPHFILDVQTHHWQK